MFDHTISSTLLLSFCVLPHQHSIRVVTASYIPTVSVSHRAQRSVHLPLFAFLRFQQNPRPLFARFRDVALEGVSLDAWCSGPRAALHARSPHRLRPAGTAPAGVNGPVGPSGASLVQEPSHARNGWDQAWHPRDVWLEDAQHKRGTSSFLGVRPFAYSSNSGWMCPCQDRRFGALRLGWASSCGTCGVFMGGRRAERCFIGSQSVASHLAVVQRDWKQPLRLGAAAHVHSLNTLLFRRPLDGGDTSRRTLRLIVRAPGQSCSDRLANANLRVWTCRASAPRNVCMCGIRGVWCVAASGVGVQVGHFTGGRKGWAGVVLSW